MTTQFSINNSVIESWAYVELAGALWGKSYFKRFVRLQQSTVYVSESNDNLTTSSNTKPVDIFGSFSTEILWNGRNGIEIRSSGRTLLRIVFDNKKHAVEFASFAKTASSDQPIRT